MTPEELKDRFRSEVQDQVAPYLWSEDDLWTYMDWAHKEYVRLIGGIADSTSPVSQIEIIAGEEFAEYSDRILKIRLAWRLSDFHKVDVVDIGDLGTYTGDDYGLSARLVLTDKTGPVRAMITSLEENKVRWLDIPVTSDTLQMNVMRLPLCTLQGEDNETFEVREEYHIDLLHGMKYKAHLKQDAETFDKGRADQSLAAFRAAAESAKMSQGVRKHKPRSISYGGV